MNSDERNKVQMVCTKAIIKSRLPGVNNSDEVIANYLADKVTKTELVYALNLLESLRSAKGLHKNYKKTGIKE